MISQPLLKKIILHREINRLSQHFKNQSKTLAWVHPWNLAEAFMIVASPTYFDKEI